MAGDPPALFQQQLMEHSAFIAYLYGAVFVVGFILLVGFTLWIQTHPISWAEPVQRLLRRPWTVRDVAVVVTPLLVIQAGFVIGYAVYAPPEDFPADRLERVVTAIQGVLFHVAGLVLVIFLARKKGVGWAEGFGAPGRRVAGSVLAGGLALLGVMPLIIAYNVSAQLLMHWWDVTPQVQDVTRIISGASGVWAKAYFFVLAVVVAPVVEEVLFRGMLLPALARLVGVRPALVVVAVLFALVHGLYLPSAIIFFILSIAFSLAYIHRGTLVTPVVMHAAFNALTMIVLLRM